MQQRREATGGTLTDNELLLNAFEYGALCVSRGADPDTDEFTMYAYGRRMILERMKDGG
jgi:hypothetical protein